MVLKFHGFNQDGSFQTGQGELVRLWTIHEIGQTGVNLTRDELVSEGILATNDLTVNAITINGVTYAVDATYDDALWAQGNLDAIIAAFSEFANPVQVAVYAGVATAATPTADFATVFIAGADTMGTEITAANAPAWRLDLEFEQKGMFVNPAGSVSFVKGDVTVGAAADKYGSNISDIHVVLRNTVLTTTANDVDAVDDTTTTNTESRPDDAPQVAGSVTWMVTAESADEATNQSVIGEVFVAPNMQS